MLACKKADVEALEAILEVLKGSLQEEPAKDEQAEQGVPPEEKTADSGTRPE